VECLHLAVIARVEDMVHESHTLHELETDHSEEGVEEETEDEGQKVTLSTFQNLLIKQLLQNKHRNLCQSITSLILL
jgi:hypothetical protein